jgi:hypothetical protein
MATRREVELSRLTFASKQALREDYGFTDRWIGWLGNPDKEVRNASFSGAEPIKLFYLPRVHRLIEEKFDLYLKRWQKIKFDRENAAEILKEKIERHRERVFSGWKRWLERNDGDREIAIAEGMWLVNKFARDGLIDSGVFYPIKDQWIAAHQHCLTEGQFVRDECGWDGSYTRTLFCHNFSIHGRSYCFHSFKRPKFLSQKHGADLSSYGEELTEEHLSRTGMSPRDFFDTIGWVMRNGDKDEKIPVKRMGFPADLEPKKTTKSPGGPS